MNNEQKCNTPSKHETIADIVREMRIGDLCANDTTTSMVYINDFLAGYADRFEAAHQREVAELKRQRKEALAIASDIDKCASIERHTDAMLKKNEVIVGLRKEVAELTAIINAECRKCGECEKFGKDCTAGDVDGAEDNRACEKFVSREVSELRECLKEAIREKCPFTRMSCKHGEPCDYECGTFKWRNALRKEGGAK